MAKINLKEFKKIVKQYQEAYDKAEVGTLDHAWKGNDLAILETVSLLITGDKSKTEDEDESEDTVEDAPVKSADEVTEQTESLEIEAPKEDVSQPSEINETDEIKENND